MHVSVGIFYDSVMAAEAQVFRLLRPGEDTPRMTHVTSGIERFMNHRIE